MSAYGINPAESGMMIGTNPPTEECGQTLRKSPGGENGVLQMQNQTDIETAYRIKINLRPAVLCSHRCEECRFCTFSGDEDGGEYVWCRHPHTLSLPNFFNIMEENMVCNLFEPCPEVQTVGFKAGQSKDGGLGDEREVSPTLSQMRYIVRRLTPIEAERLMGLPDGWTIPTGLRRYFGADGEPSPELVDEFVERFDTFNAIMAAYEHKAPPKGKSRKQVAEWLKKISDAETCPDSPRYKGCGNGQATNQPRWIVTRLLAIGEGIDPFTGEEL